MADTYALLNLYDLVVADFTARAVVCSQYFGWRESRKHPLTINAGGRITWAPGDPDGDIGELIGPVGPGGNPRSLGTLKEFCTCHISALDTANHESDRHQYIAARALFDEWYKSVYQAARGTFGIDSVEWLAHGNERLNGAAIQVVIWVEAMLPGLETATAPVDTGAVIDTTILDVTDVITITG